MRKPAATVAALLLLIAAGCSRGHTAASRPSIPTAAPTTGALPPESVAELAPTVDPLVESLGLHLTRAKVVSRSTGAHLALYFRPLTTFTDDRYIQTVVPLGAALTPFVFLRWPGLGSYDVCQEPSTGDDGRAEPESVTVLDVSRSYASATDWSKVQLKTLVADDLSHRPGILVGVTSRLAAMFQAASG